MVNIWRFGLFKLECFTIKGLEGPLIQTMNKFVLRGLVVWKMLGDLIYINVDLHFSFGVMGNINKRTDYIRVRKSYQ